MTALLYCCWPLCARASTNKVETYKEIIEKSYVLSQQHDRLQATQVLINAIKKEDKKSNAFKELNKALEQVSSVFYSDKTQQLYELALSVRSTDLAMSNNRLNEALRIEPDNLSTLVDLARNYLSISDCGNAGAQVKKASEVNPYSPVVDLLVAQWNVCLGKAFIRDLKTTAQNPFWATLEAEHSFQSQKYDKAVEAAQLAVKIDKSYPEAYYWIWKSHAALKQPFKDEAQKYLNMCKSLSLRAQRNYFVDPKLCVHVNETQDKLNQNAKAESQ